MILVSVSQNYASELIPVFFNISKIRYNYIYARHFRIGKSKSAVDYKHIVGAFYNGHILSDLVQASERNYSYRRSSRLSLRLGNRRLFYRYGRNGALALFIRCRAPLSRIPFSVVLMIFGCVIFHFLTSLFFSGNDRFFNFK